jgi:alpha-L-fucosidase
MGTRPWRTYGEGPTKVAAGSFHDTDTSSYTPEDFRFTSKGSTLYAIELGWPSTGEAVIHSLGIDTASGANVESVALLGADAKLQFRQQPDGLHIHLPGSDPGHFAYCFRIGLKN